jgi:hypothetical protein
MTSEDVEPQFEGASKGSESAVGNGKPSNVLIDDDDDSPIPAEVLERLPPQMREVVSQSIGFMSSGPMQNPIARKVTEAHIGKMIDNDEKNAVRDYRLAQTGRFFTTLYILLAIGSFFAFAWMFAEKDRELFQQVVAIFATFVAGFGAGWGFNASRKSSDD